MSDIKQGVVTFENPFIVVANGIAFREEKNIVLFIEPYHSAKTFCEICKALNFAYHMGFDEGQQTLSDIIQKQ